MKNFEIKPALEALRKINLSLIKDVKVKNSLFLLSLELLAANRTLQQKQEDVRAVILGPVQDSIDEVNKLIYIINNESDVEKRKELQDKINSHKELIEPNFEFTQKIERLMKEELKIDTINKDDFISAISELDNIDLTVLDGLYPILSE